MSFCPNCRTYVPDGVDTCPKCGTKDPRYTNIPSQTQPTTHSCNKVSRSKKPLVQLLKKIVKTEDMTAEFDVRDISANSNNAVLAYLGPLLIIPLIIARKSKFAMFHCCQGMMNFVFGLLYMILMPIILDIIPDILVLLLIIPFLLFLISFPIFAVLGIVNAIRGKAVTLPVFGRIDLMRVLFKNL